MFLRVARRLVGGEPQSLKRHNRNLKMGPYAGGRIIPSFKEDPQEYILSAIIIGITIYGIMNLSSGESYPERRRRLIRERIRKEYDLPEGWDDEIEGHTPTLAQ
jgi:hypothetical protein